MANAKKQGKGKMSVAIDKDGAKATTTSACSQRAKSVTTVVEKPKGATSAHTGAKNGKAGSRAEGKVTVATRGNTARQTAKGGADLESLRRSVENAQSLVDGAKKEAAQLQEQARKLVAEARSAYHTALAPYREACRKAGVKCEFTGGRAANVSERVAFLVEKVDKGVRVAVKRQPETAEVIPKAKLKVSIGKAAYQYTEKHLGPREEVGNKAGSLANRLRTILTS